MQNTKKAFTLVELIVVITILAVLATVAFISFQGYGQSARDSTRLSDMKSMEKLLDLSKLTNNRYPTPVNSASVTYSGSIAWTQGVFGQTAYTGNASMSNVPVDPVTALEYPYSITANGQEYQLAAVLENPEASTITSTYAGTQEAQIYVKGNYNGQFLKVRKDNTTYLLGVPSILTSDIVSSQLLEDILTNNRLVYNGHKNLPSSFSGSVYKTDGGFDFGGAPYVASDMILFEGDTSDLETDPAQRVTLLDKLQASYSGSVIQTESGISELLSVDSSSSSASSNYVANALNNSLKTSITITESSGSSAAVSDDYPGCDTPDITVGAYTISACNAGTSVAGLTTASYGGLYQWGNNYDSRGDQTVTGNIYPTTSTTLVSSTTDDSTYSSSAFITSSASPYDWASPQNNNLWGDTTNTDIARQGPCATGYHVPSQTEWAGIISAGGWGTNGTNMSTALKLPLAGYRIRTDASLIRQGSYGYYWSSSPNGSYGYFLLFYWSGIVPANSNLRAIGSSVRCFKN